MSCLIVAVQGQHLALDELHLARGHELAHARDRRGRCTKFRAPVHQRERARLLAQRHRPVEGGVPAAADHEIAAVIIGRRFHAVMHALALELLDALEREPPRLEGAHAGGNHHRARGQSRAGARRHVKLAVGECS